MKLFFCLCLAFTALGCDNPPPAHNPGQPVANEFISFPGANAIVVVYAAQADFSVPDIPRIEIKEAATVKKWLDTLGKIPRQGPGLLIKMLANAPEYQIDFFQGRELLGTLRMKGGKLDAPAGKGWDFYDNEDKAFVKLVTQSVGGGK